MSKCWKHYPSSTGPFYTVTEMITNVRIDEQIVKQINGAIQAIISCPETFLEKIGDTYTTKVLGNWGPKLWRQLSWCIDFIPGEKAVTLIVVGWLIWDRNEALAVKSMGKCKKDVTPMLTHCSSFFLALTRWNVITGWFCTSTNRKWHPDGYWWDCDRGAISWWRHQMETFSALLAICAGNSPVPGESPAQRPVTRSFDVFFDLRLNKRLSKQSWGWWFETPSRRLWYQRDVFKSNHCNSFRDRVPVDISPGNGFRKTCPILLKCVQYKPLNWFLVHSVMYGLPYV